MPMYNNNLKPYRSYNLFLYFLVAIISFVVGWQLTALGIFDGGNAEKKSSLPILNEESKHGADLDLFWTVWEKLEDQYVDSDKINGETMVYGSIKGLVDSLSDPYTVFMTPDETKEFSSSLEGTLEGIGAQLTVKDKKLIIVSPLKNSPAEKAGLLAGDIIDKIEGKPTSEMTLLDAVMNIRGEKGTTVIMTIIRESNEPFDVSIVRDSIDIESVTVEKLDGDLVYLGVNQFNDKTNDEFGKAISELILDEPKGLIVDLRFNGGGYLDIAVELLSYLLPSGTDAVLIKERGKEDNMLKTNGNPKLLKTPLVVLVNESSASASEILAGAIQDHQRGIIMGAKTFGKGSVQQVDTFSDGSSIRMTIAKWFTPNGRTINEVGLIPDMIVETTEEDFKNEKDPQKDAAINYLKNL